MKPSTLAACAALVVALACVPPRATPTPMAATAPAPPPTPAAAILALPPASPTATPLPRPDPYPVPASCPATPLTGRQVRWTFPAWWLDGRGIAVGTPVGALFAGRNKLMWQLFPNDPFRFSSARLDGPAPPAELFVTGFGPSGLVFAVGGCWRIRAEAPGDRTLDATVYVYPWACRPESMRGDPPPSPELCSPP